MNFKVEKTDSYKIKKTMSNIWDAVHSKVGFFDYTVYIKTYRLTSIVPYLVCFHNNLL